MNKKILIFVGLVVIVGAGITFIVVNNNKDKKNEENSSKQTVQVDRINNDALILYYGDGCPHCKNIENYIEANLLDQKLNITQKEIWYNKDNSKELESKADICGLNKDTVGIPFLFDSSTNKCYTGEVDVQKILDEKAGIQS